MIGGDDEAIAVVMLRIPLRAALSGQFRNGRCRCLGRLRLEDVDQQALADDESGVWQRVAWRGYTFDGDRLKNVVRAVAAERAANEVLDGLTVSGFMGIAASSV